MRKPGDLPLPFRFEVRYVLTGATLRITYAICNTGDAVLPASMGAHPAFRWPLVPGTPKEAYSLTFDAPETGNAARSCRRPARGRAASQPDRRSAFGAA